MIMANIISNNRFRIIYHKLFAIIVLVLIVFRDCIEYLVGFNYIDEVLCLFLFLYGIAIRGYGKIRNEKIELLLIMGLIIYNLLGWISTFFHCYQELSISVKSAFLSNKFFLTLIGCGYIYKYSSKDIFIHYLQQYARGFLVLFVMFFTICKNSWISYDLGAIVICANVVFLLSLIFKDWRGGRDIIYIIIAVLLMTSTNKAKGYGGALLITAIYLWVICYKRNVKIKEIALGIIGCICIAWKKIYYYYIYGVEMEYPRSMLLNKGIDISNNSFPIGTGWGTFNSYYANLYYSPVYTELGWDSHLMLGRERGMLYMNDIYWPGVYCETGWIGLIGVLILLGCVYYKINKQFYLDRRIYAAGLLVFGYLMITTFESTAFAHPALLGMAIILGMVIGNNECERIKGI